MTTAPSTTPASSSDTDGDDAPVVPPTRRRRSRVKVAGVVVLALVAGVLAATGALAAVRQGEVLPGVSVAGVDVGLLGSADARAALQGLAAGREQREVVLAHDGTTHVVTAGDAGYELDLTASAARARAHGFDDRGVLGTAVAQWEVFGTDVDLEPVERVDDEAVRARVEQIAADVDLEPDRGDVTIDATALEATAVLPVTGRSVDVDATVALVTDALLVGREAADTTVTDELPVDAVEPILTAADVEAVADQADAVLDGPLTFTGADGAAAELPAEMLAPWLRMEVDEPSGDATTGTARLGVDPAALLNLTRGFRSTFETAPQDASFDVPRAPVSSIDDKNGGTWTPVAVDVGVVEAVDGTRVDGFGLVTAAEAAFAEGADRVEVPLVTRQADFTTADAEGFGLTHLLGSFTTYHACCANRVRNIQTLADVIDGTLVGPGEQFSINQLSGIRTCQKGYAAAGMILDGEIVDVCGGGVSQFGTTMFNAAFFANTQLDAWKAHSFFISRYPRGREATLNYPSPDIDVRFTNTTDAGMLVRTSYTGTSITVAIYGTPDFARTTAVHSEAYNWRSPSTRYKEDKSLAPGASRVTQSGASGFSIDIDRVTELGDGENEMFEFTTVYVPKLQIVERNTSPAPAPDPPAEG